MVDGTSDDDIIRERAFRISDKLDLGDLVDDSKFVEGKSPKMIVKMLTMLSEMSLIRSFKTKHLEA